MTSFTMEPNGFLIAGQLAALGVSVRSFREPLKRTVQQIILPSIAENFAVGGRPEWEPLSEATEANREYWGYGSGSPLVRSGKLLRAATALARWTITSDTASTGGSWPGSVYYGPYQDEGTSKQPARPFMEIQEEDIDKAQVVFMLWARERLVLAGFIGGSV